MKLSVLSAASEAVPLIKTGGLADVVGALPEAVAKHDVVMTTLLPGYPAVMHAIREGRTLYEYESLLGEHARLVASRINGHPLIVLDAPGFFARDGGPYADPAGHDWADNWRRFAAFARAAADLAGGAVHGQRFDLIHAHDWQAAMALAFQRFSPVAGSQAIPSVMTIHNIAFQGNFTSDIFPLLGLPECAWSMHGVEYHGVVGFLKAGLEAASAITTVSPTYAREIRTEEFGMGLEGLVISRGERVSGIVNGIDTGLWNPESDPHLPQCFSARSLSRRVTNKRALEEEFGLAPGDGPLFTVISRLTWQKGMDVLLESIDHLIDSGCTLAVLGSGDRAIEAGFHAAQVRHPGRISVRLGYDEGLAHRMQGGGDAILVPSRFEPCGLTQLYGLAYGNVPVVSRTGGLADTVIDANLAAITAGAATGIQSNGVDEESLVMAISRAVDLYRQPEIWRAIQRRGMNSDFSWASSGAAYVELYRSLLA